MTANYPPQYHPHYRPPHGQAFQRPTPPPGAMVAHKAAPMASAAPPAADHPGDQARMRAEVARNRFAGWADRSQLRPLMASVAFEVKDGKIVAKGRRAFVDAEGGAAASGVAQDEANSTFGGARTTDVEWTLDALALVVYNDGPEALSRQEEMLFRCKTSVTLKISESPNHLGNAYLYGAGTNENASLDYSAVRRFEPIPLQKQKHFSCELKLLEDIPLRSIKEGRIIVHVIFLGFRDIDPADKASV